MIDLYTDPDGKPTRGPLYKTRPNRGLGHREKGGAWTYVGGMLYGARADERSAHNAWVAVVEKLGHLVGRRSNDGVVSFYVWTPS